MDTTKFKVGQRVRYIGNDTIAHLGKEGTVTELDGVSNIFVMFDYNRKGRKGHGVYPSNLELLEEVTPAPTNTKATNPKDAIGSSKLSFHLVPDTAKVYMALAFTEGALKYGSSNWRVAGVRASIYKSALERHLAKYWNGEWADPKTGVPHLASVMACAAIILDANLAGKLTDDRPPKVVMAGLIDGLEPVIKNLQEMFKDHTPHHHTAAEME